MVITETLTEIEELLNELITESENDKNLADLRRNSSDYQRASLKQRHLLKALMEIKQTKRF